MNATAIQLVDTYLDFGTTGQDMNWTAKQVEQFRVDIINFVVDGKLPNNQSKEYNRSVSDDGMYIINQSKQADAQKKLNSEDGD